MQKVLSWERFINESSNQLTPSQVKFIEEHQEEGSEWEIDEKTGLVNLFSSFGITDKPLKELPVKFGKCYGDFRINSCGLESISGIPTVAHVINLNRNDIKTVRDLKSRASGTFGISYNQITSFAGIDPYCYFTTIYAYQCRLITLQGLSPSSFRVYNFDDNPIPQSTLLESLHSDGEIYYKKIVEKYKDTVADLWNDLDPEIQESIAKAHGENKENFYRWMKASTRIY
jgi:hypothetical protein